MRKVGFRAYAGEACGLPAALRDGWVGIVADGLTGPGRVVAFIDIGHEPDANGDARREEILLRQAGRGRFVAVWFLAASARSIRLVAYGRLDAAGSVALGRPRRIGPIQAAVRLLARPGGLPRLLARGAVGPAALKARLRETQAAVIGDRRALSDYASWIATFATWSAADIAEPLHAPSIGLLVFARSVDRPAMQATLGSLGTHASFRVVGGDAGWRDALMELPADAAGYVGIVQAGEVLTPHAISLARALLPRLGAPAFAIADEDRLDGSGRRTSPSFRPVPNHALMLSGTLARGLWLVRRDVLEEFGRTVADRIDWAELLRLELWLRCREAGGDGGRRLPHILSSARPDAERAPADAVASVIGAHLGRSALAFRAVPSWPVRLQPLPRQHGRPVTAVVPSTLTALHAARCLEAFLSGTDHPDFAMVVVVAQKEPLGPEQRAVAERLAAAHPNCRIVHRSVAAFNFAQAVNHGAAEASARDGDILLLNDDVEPTAPDWLARMAAHLTDPRVGIVGARLLYPDGSMQHGGIVMGLAGFCEHAFRHLPAGSTGYDWRAVLPQRLLAATGACLLVSAGTWRAVGGMDETYPSAFNDVDLCLRAGEAGAEVVLSDATLIHHELQTYGSHYAGERAPFERAEVGRMRRRWAAVIASDPYYSPNLDPFPGREWTACFPPRLTIEGGEQHLSPDAS